MPRISTNAPSRGARLSATTMRYDGFFFLPVRRKRMRSNDHLLRGLARLDFDFVLAEHTRQEAATLGICQRLHHATRFVELLEKLVHLGDGRAGTCRNAPLAPRAALLEELRVAALLEGHRKDNGFGLFEEAIVEIGRAS